MNMAPTRPDLTPGRPYMSFGRYAGRPVADVPSDYLGWCAARAKGLSPTLRSAIEQELLDRACRVGRPTHNERGRRLQPPARATRKRFL